MHRNNAQEYTEMDAARNPPLSSDLLEGAQAAADYIGISRGTLYRLVEQKRVPVIRMGPKQLFFRKSELDRAFQAAA